MLLLAYKVAQKAKGGKPPRKRPKPLTPKVRKGE